MKIVIADDSSLMRDRIKILLTSINHNSEMFEAEDGVEALQLIEENEPDLAILDIRMPGLSGIAAMLDGSSCASDCVSPSMAHLLAQ